MASIAPEEAAEHFGWFAHFAGVDIFATRQGGYSFYIDLLMRTGAEALALETSERSRARSLLEMLGASATEIRQGVDPNLLERERDLSNRLNAKGARLLALSATSPQAAELT